jgi:hypothetical protein
MQHMTLFNGADPLGVACVIVGAIATVWTFYLAIRMTIAPGEEQLDHPKYAILREDR